jgi:hypothetical protein
MSFANKEPICALVTARPERIVGTTNERLNQCRPNEDGLSNFQLFSQINSSPSSPSYYTNSNHNLVW